MNNKVNIKNRRANYDYQLLDKFVAGIKLYGTEIKSIRQGKANIQDAFGYFAKGELWLKNMHISEYDHSGYTNHEVVRDRKLLLNRRELNKLEAKMKEKGQAIIATKIFISDRGFAKVEIALAKGKKEYDKRDSIKERDVKREIDKKLKQYK